MTASADGASEKYKAFYRETTLWHHFQIPEGGGHSLFPDPPAYAHAAGYIWCKRRRRQLKFALRLRHRQRRKQHMMFLFSIFSLRLPLDWLAHNYDYSIVITNSTMTKLDKLRYGWTDKPSFNVLSSASLFSSIEASSVLLLSPFYEQKMPEYLCDVDGKYGKKY